MAFYGSVPRRRKRKIRKEESIKVLLLRTKRMDNGGVDERGDAVLWECVQRESWRWFRGKISGLLRVKRRWMDNRGMRIGCCGVLSWRCVETWGRKEKKRYNLKCLDETREKREGGKERWIFRGMRSVLGREKRRERKAIEERRDGGWGERRELRKEEMERVKETWWRLLRSREC